MGGHEEFFEIFFFLSVFKDIAQYHYIELLSTVGRVSHSCFSCLVLSCSEEPEIQEIRSNRYVYSLFYIRCCAGWHGISDL
jgi:hypothetical protein